MSVTHILHPLADLAGTLSQSRRMVALLDVCSGQGVTPFLVGGVVRDWLFHGRLSADIDAVVPPELAKPIAQAVAERLSGKLICLDPQFGIYRVIVFPSLKMIDIAGCIGPDITADLMRRDMTVNALGYNPVTRELLDPAGGLTDLTAGRIRMVSRKNMLDDPLRLIRLFRVGTELGFTDYDAETLALVQENGSRLFRSAVERIHYEWMKLLSAPRCFSHIQLMASVGLLERLFPELSAMHPIPGNDYHHLPLFEHTLELLNQAEIHFPQLPQEIRSALNEPVTPFATRMAVCRLACLFHDLGKPATMSYEPATGRYKFYEHDRVSEILVWGIAQRFPWGKDITRSVMALVRQHLYPGDLLKPSVGDKAFRRFFRRVGTLLPEMILLAIADRYSAQGPKVTRKDLETQKDGLIDLWHRAEAVRAAEPPVVRLLSGRKIMAILGLTPGPQVGKLAKAVDEAYLNGEISTEAEAIDWLQSRFGVKN